MIVVNTKNEREWYAVQRAMVVCGKLWSNGRREMSYDTRELYGDSACIDVGNTSMMYCSYAYYTNHNYNIISFKEFIKRVKENRYEC